jgi:hypothetical protein
VDPGSPAGKEYALPLDQARRQARGGDSSGGGGAGGSAQKSSSGRSALFGEGIKPAKGQSAGKAAGGAGAAGGGSTGAGAPGSEAARRLSAPTAAGSGSPTLTDGGIALAVLLAAGGLGLLFRRVLR